MYANRLKSAALLGVLSLAIVACSSDSNSSATDGAAEGNVLTIAPLPWMVEKLNIEEAVETFETDNPGVTVDIKPYPDKESLANFALSWSADKTDVDLVALSIFENAAGFVEQDLLVDFDDTTLFGEGLARDDFVGDTLDFGRYMDTQFGIPVALEVYAVNTNRDLLNDVGSDGDLGDWDAILTAAKAFKDRDEEGIAIQWGVNAQATMLATVIATGEYDEDDILSYDHPEMRKVLENWKLGVSQGAYSTMSFTDYQSPPDNYNAGKLAMMVQSGSESIAAIENLGEDVSGVLPIPGSSENGSYAFTPGWIMPRSSSNQDLAIRFMQEALMDPENQADAAEAWGKLPILSEAYDTLDADWAGQLLEIAENSKTAPYYDDYALLDEQMPALLQQYLTSDMSLDDFIEETDALILEASS